MALFDIAGLTGRNTVLKAGFASPGFWNNMIDGEPQFFTTAISASEPISDKDIFLAKGDAGSIDRSN